MGREIKFRFRLKLIVDEWGTFKKGDTNMFFIGLDSLSRFSIDNRWDIISRDEFTGLKDKNGVDIYEGDICKTTYYNYVEKNSVFTQTVVFENGNFAVKSLDKETSEIDEWRSFSSIHQFFSPTPNKIEVIGNIHETPNP